MSDGTAGRVLGESMRQAIDVEEMERGEAVRAVLGAGTLDFLSGIDQERDALALAISRLEERIEPALRSFAEEGDDSRSWQPLPSHSTLGERLALISQHLHDMTLRLDSITARVDW